jgi:hypothetical protein
MTGQHLASFIIYEGWPDYEHNKLENAIISSSRDRYISSIYSVQLRMNYQLFILIILVSFITVTLNQLAFELICICYMVDILCRRAAHVK